MELLPFYNVNESDEIFQYKINKNKIKKDNDFSNNITSVKIDKSLQYQPNNNEFHEILTDLKNHYNCIYYNFNVESMTSLDNNYDGITSIEELKEEIKICMICDDQLDDLKVFNGCSSINCHYKYCKKCFLSNTLENIKDNIYSIPKIKCCLCFNKINTKTWMKVLSKYNTDSITKQSGSESIYKIVSRNIRALMQIRCSSCHIVRFVFPKNQLNYPKVMKKLSIKNQINEIFYTEVTINYKKYITCLYSMKFVESVLISLYKLTIGVVTTKSFINNIITYLQEDIIDTSIHGLGYFLSNESIMQFIDRSNYGIQPLLLTTLIDNIIFYINDITLAMDIYIALLSSYPFIYSPCCQQPHCYKCQVTTHHNGISCKKLCKQLLNSSNIKFCPHCDIPLLKTEGCDHVTCICGNSFDYSSVVSAEITDSLSEDHENEEGQIDKNQPTKFYSERKFRIKTQCTSCLSIETPVDNCNDCLEFQKRFFYRYEELKLLLS